MDKPLTFTLAMTKKEYDKLCEIELLIIDDDTYPIGIGELHKFIMARKKEIIKIMLERIRDMINATRKIGDGVYLIPDDSGKYHIYRNKNIAKKAREEVKAMFKKYR